MRITNCCQLMKILSTNMQTSPLLASFQEFIKKKSLQKSTLAVAVSGGIDSVALCELCAQAGVSFLLLHCNFGLRGPESHRDEAFVRSLGDTYKTETLVVHFDTASYASEKKCSIQEAARELRYEWFTQIHKERKADYILLAHHANDNIETLLMNFFRGTGLEGLTGMPEAVTHAFCLRPLLHNTRQQIEQFAKDNQLTWVEDSSNRSSKYTRNFFRNEILPALKKVYPQVEENLMDNIERFKKIDALYHIGVEKLLKDLCEYKGSEVHIPLLKLVKYQHTSLIYELIKLYGFGEKQVPELIKLIHSESGKYIENNEYQIIRHRNKLIISPRILTSETMAIEADVKKLQLGERQLVIRHLNVDDFKLNKSESIAQLDAALVTFPLLIRKWKQGDYFYPLGMRKKKKLARFFIDQKLSLADKEKIYVVESAKRIIWIIGLRIDDRFKITPSTKNVLELSISSL